MTSNYSDISRRHALEGIGAAALAAGIVPAQGAASLQPVAAIIDTAQTRPPISRMMYGALIEQIGSLITYSLWSEVLDDRKFFYAVDDQPPPAGRRTAGNKWRPLGPQSAITMAPQDAYVGDHSPRVVLAAGEARGLRQQGLSLAAKGYRGRMVVKGDPGARVHVTLVWGSGAADRQSQDVAVTGRWATVPLRFACRADTTQGQIEIAGSGSGSFQVGAVSLMPDDNIGGFRADTIALLKQLDSGFYRVPGGNFVSGYDWFNTVGDPDKRPTTMDPAWNAPQANDVGIDELIRMCALLGVEPYLCVNSGYGTASHDGAALVEYCNGDAGTPMGGLRAANGHRQPYKVKYWNIGNEMYGPWQTGFMPPDQYMTKHNMFAHAMRKVDPSISIIAVGAMPDEMTIDRCFYYIDTHSRDVVGTPNHVTFGSPNDWTYRLIKECSGNFDFISEHSYGDAHRFDLATGILVNADVQESVLDSCRRAPNRVRLKREYWDQYVKAFPALSDGKVKISVDEWGFRNARGLKQTLGIAMYLHELSRNTDIITMAAFTMGMSWLSYNRTQSIYSNAGLLFRMFQNFGTIPVAVDGHSPQPAPKWPVGGDQPRVNAGSPTFPLDIAAALTADGKVLTVSLVNATETAHPVALDLRGFPSLSAGRVLRLTGASLAAENLVGRPAQVTVSETDFDAGRSPLTIAPYSVELYRFTRA